MGAVYQAWQRNLRRFVAIKILPPEFEDGDVQFAERFRREARAMARLVHPGIVSVYDNGETADGLLYFTMEYVEGTDVQKMVVAQGHLSPSDAISIAIHVCDALAYAHQSGVIHRDIKPSNIMVNKEGRVKVGDFGLAKVTDSDSAMLTGTHLSMGTPDFMAPETLMGIGNADHRADLYAVGVMLYRMLTGQLPRGRFDPASHCVSELDSRIDAIIDRALQPRPEKRYSSADEISVDLRRVLDEYDPSKPKAPASELPGDLALARADGETGGVTAPLSPLEAGDPTPRKRNRLKMALAGVAVAGLSVLVWAGSAILKNPGGPSARLVMFRSPKPATPAATTPKPTPAAPSRTPAPVNRFDELMQQGKVLRERGDLAQAIIKFREASTADPKSPIPLAELAVTYEKMTMGEKATEHWKKIYNMGDSAGIYYQAAEARLRASQANVARKAENTPAPVPQAPAGTASVIVPTTATEPRPTADIFTSPDYEWSSPENLGSGVNSAKDEFAFGISDDGLDLVLSSTRDGVEHLFACRRELASEPFGKAELIAELKSGVQSCPFLSSDGLTLVFAQQSRTHDPTADIFESHRANRHEHWAKSNFLLSPGGYSGGPCLSRDGLTLWFHSNRAGGKGGFDLWRSTRASSTTPFGKPENLGPGANSDWDDMSPRITVDGSALLFYREKNRTNERVFISLRDETGAFVAYGLPVPINGRIQSPSLSADGSILYFSSDMRGGYGGWDLWQIKRLLKPKTTGQQTSPAAGAGSLVASKEKPFVNSLEMKFVPVPIVGGATGGRTLFFSTWETRVKDYQSFVDETNHQWLERNLEAGPTHPVMMTAWDDAQAFCNWLTDRERKAGLIGADQLYRLPTDHEWSCAVGIGELEDPSKIPAEKSKKIADVYPWGKGWPPPKGAGNYSGAEAIGHFSNENQGTIPGYRDDFPETAPVGSFLPNRFGIFDLGGNVWEWCQDWYDSKQEYRVARGASYDYETPGTLLSSYRGRAKPEYLGFGFRCVLAANERNGGAAPSNADH
jgi:hypothetical protein